MQNTNHILMIRPAKFVFNAQTAINNSFQVAENDANVPLKALAEFDAMVKTLQNNGVTVTVVQDTPEPATPDSIFPNNWISFHENGTICLYPMFAQNRRLERKPTVLSAIQEKFSIKNTIDFSEYEQQNTYLEGTGSMVLDRQNRIAYACVSPRTDKILFEEWCSKMQYQPIAFSSVDENGDDIYHTNVMMCVADKYVVICLESIPKTEEKEKVLQILAKTNKTIVNISYYQMNHFAGNMLQVQNKEGQKMLVMSTQAYQSLLANQIATIEQFNPIVHANIATIETNGGGSARCMMAEIFLEPNQ